MINSKASQAVVGLALCALWAPAACAKVTEIFTISDFESTQPGGTFSAMESVTGYWTEGTTAADSTSEVTVKEEIQGTVYEYVYTGPENGPGWSVQSQYTSVSGETAAFRVYPFGPGPVSTDVTVTLDDFVFNSTGTVTITETAPNSVPEPATWAMMLVGFAGLALAGLKRVRGRTAPVAVT
jgi:PEP-CTERM motif